MLQLNYIKENKQATIDSLKRKYFKNAEETIETVLSIDQKRRETQTELDATLGRANALAKEIGGLMKAGKKVEAEDAKAETAELKIKSKALEEDLKTSEAELYEVMVTIPNLPHASVPEGRTPEENVNVFQAGTIPELHERALPHWELIKNYDIIDFDLGNKITGAGFPVYKGKGARIQRAMINFFLDEALVAGYTEIQPPILINKDSGFGTGQLPDKEGQMYHSTVDDLYLIPTAEVPVQIFIVT